MWDEDPRYQQAHYRLLVWTVVVGTFGGLCVSLWTGDWGPYQTFLEVLGVILAALCIYAALVWTVGHGVAKLVTIAKNWWHGHGQS